MTVKFGPYVHVCGLDRVEDELGNTLTFYVYEMGLERLAEFDTIKKAQYGKKELVLPRLAQM